MRFVILLFTFLVSNAALACPDLVTELESHKLQLGQAHNVVINFYNDLSVTVLGWHSQFSPLEGEDTQVASGYFLPISELSIRTSEMADSLYDRSQQLEQSVETMLQLLPTCGSGDPWVSVTSKLEAYAVLARKTEETSLDFLDRYSSGLSEFYDSWSPVEGSKHSFAVGTFDILQQRGVEAARAFSYHSKLFALDMKSIEKLLETSR